jgi:hypothetical protein
VANQLHNRGGIQIAHGTIGGAAAKDLFFSLIFVHFSPPAAVSISTKASF